MAITREMKATSRTDAGKGASRRLRHAGEVPAVIYGANQDPASIKLSHNDVWLASQHEWFYSAILDLDIDGKTQKVLLRDMQRHPYKQIIMHLDFLRVDESQPLRAAVQLRFLNQAASPAGKNAEAVIMHELTAVTVECLPKDLPEGIEVDLSDLTVGTVIHLSDLKLPAGVEIPELKLGKEHDVAVVIAKLAREEASDAGADADK